MILGASLNTLVLFPNQNVQVHKPQFRFYAIICDFGRKVKNDDFQNILEIPCHSWFFVAKVLPIKKFEISAFTGKKLISYLNQIKSYVNLKFSGGTVSCLYLSFSYESTVLRLFELANALLNFFIICSRHSRMCECSLISFYFIPLQERESFAQVGKKRK